MLTQRLMVIIFLVPIVAAFIYWGGWPFAIFIAIIMAIAAWEYWRIFQQGGYNNSKWMLVLGTVFLVLRPQIQYPHNDLLISLPILLATGFHVIDYERGNQKAALSLCISLGGIFYLGWLGSHFTAFNTLPDGKWWLLVALPVVWFSDAGGYLIGRWIGRHPFSPKVSPKKTWEGYFGGVLFSILGGAFLGFLWNMVAPSITIERGMIIGAVVSVVAPLGDLAESMLKRQFGLKDSGNLLPGHGGILDRIDTWLWAATIVYYMVILLWA